MAVSAKDSKLFEYECRSQNKKHTFEQGKAYRLEKEKTILDAFWSWLDEQKVYMMVSKSLSNSIKRFLKKNNLMAVKRMKITIY